MNIIPIHFFINAIYIEFSLVILIVLLTYLMKWIFNSIERNNKQQVEQLKHYIGNSIEHKKPLLETELKSRWRTIRLLMQTLTYFDSKEKDTSFWWQEMREKLLKQYLLPLARKHGEARENGTKKLLAAKAFSYIAETEDETLIIALMKNPIPSISIEAIFATSQLPSESVINTLIDSVSHTKHDAYELYLSIFDKLPESVYSIVLNRLETEENTAKRALCYCILMHSDFPHSLEYIQKDLTSEDIELSLSVIDYLVKVEGKAATADFLALLSNKRPRIRAAALHALEKIQATGSISQIAEKLLDERPRVRLMAAHVLKRLGEAEGIKILTDAAKDETHVAFEEATLILRDDSSEDLE